VYYIQYVSVWIRKHTWLVISTVFLKLKVKDFCRSYVVTYTVNMVVSCKCCKMESLLLQTTNGKWYMACQIVAVRMSLSDLQGHSLQAFANVIFFVQLCSSWQVFNMTVRLGFPLLLIETYSKCHLVSKHRR